jgi:uncharacterized protein YdcH (DUF465 family)
LGLFGHSFPNLWNFKYDICWIIKDPVHFSKNKKTIEQELQRLINAIDRQILYNESEPKMITLAHSLFENISKLDILQEEFTEITMKEDRLGEEIADAEKEFQEQYSKLISELYNMRLSGRFALFYLLRQDSQRSRK